MRKTLLSLALVCSAGAALAAPPTAESIDRLLTLTRSESLVESMYSRMEPFMRETMRASAPAGATPAQQKAMDDMVPRLVELMREEFNWAKLKPEYIRLYQEALDQTEVDGMIAFYETPVGQSMIGKMPLVMQRSMELTQSRLQMVLPKVQRVAEESAKKLMSDR